MKRDKGTMERFIEGLEGERGFDSPTDTSQQEVRDYGIARLPCGKRRKSFSLGFVFMFASS